MGGSDYPSAMSVRSSYDTVAGAYAERFENELDHKPFDRALLDDFARSVTGPIADIGCGPGQIAAYLRGRGADVRGVDLSPGMVEQARQLFPEIPFEAADMRALPFEDTSLGGVCAFYSIIHLPSQDHPTALAELLRVLAPGGQALVSFHIGDEPVHLASWWEQEVDLDFFYFRPEAMADAFRRAGFAVDEIREREPVPDVEAQTRRAYLLAHRPR